MSNEPVSIAIVGGSGLYNMPELSDVETREIDTPFGAPSGPIRIGTIRGKRVGFIARHGRGHRHNPTHVPYRANFYALKTLGVRFVISVNACGSLREDFAPGHIVVPDQLVDFTKQRVNTFFDESGLVAHVGTADPFCPELSGILGDALDRAGATNHRGGTFVTIEGPRFSTRGESNMFRQWGMDIIGMTTCPEAFLAREAEMSFATMAHVTDYDVWHEEPVNVDMVIRTMNQNLAYARRAIVEAVGMIDEQAEYDAHSALAGAILTGGDSVSAEVVRRLGPLVSRYFA